MPTRHVILTLPNSKLIQFLKTKNIDFEIINSCYGKSIPSPGLLIGYIHEAASDTVDTSLDKLAKDSSCIIAIYYGLERGDDLQEERAKIYDYRSGNVPHQRTYEDSEINSGTVLPKIFSVFGEPFVILARELGWLIWKDM